MVRLRHKGAERKAHKLGEETRQLGHTMRHDKRFQEIADKAVTELGALERRAAEIVVSENATNCTLTTRSSSELRRLAATTGNEDALAELRRREAVPAAA